MKYIIRYDEFFIIMDTFKQALNFISVMLTDHENAVFSLFEVEDVREEDDDICVYKTKRRYYIDNIQAVEDIRNNQD